jgi:hypothetical protein
VRPALLVGSFYVSAEDLLFRTEILVGIILCRLSAWFMILLAAMNKLLLQGCLSVCNDEYLCSKGLFLFRDSL